MPALPSLFVSHGAPTYALEPGEAGAQLAAIGRMLPRPRAIVIVSAHWMTPGVRVTASAQLQTIHDFGGFPPALYSLNYPAAGDPALAARIVALLRSQGINADLDDDRGLDHGAWVPLMHMYSDADVPVVQVSIPHDADLAQALRLGQALAPLANDGVLVIGSGSLTHNLYEFRGGQNEPAPYVLEFSQWARDAVNHADTDALLHMFERAPHALRAHPSTDHYLPLLVAAGAAVNPLPVTVLDGGVRYGVLAMESYVFGQALTLPESVNTADAA